MTTATNFLADQGDITLLPFQWEVLKAVFRKVFIQSGVHPKKECVGDVSKAHTISPTHNIPLQRSLVQDLLYFNYMNRLTENSSNKCGWSLATSLHHQIVFPLEKKLLRQKLYSHIPTSSKTYLIMLCNPQGPFVHRSTARLTLLMNMW